MRCSICTTMTRKEVVDSIWRGETESMSPGADAGQHSGSEGTPDTQELFHCDGK